MKRKIFCAFLATLLAGGLCLPTQAAECSAKAALVMECATGTVLYEKNADLSLPEASTTKIMTALLVLENTSPDATVTVSPAAASVEGSQIGLAEGDTLSVRDLLYVLMLKSGNDAAVALAEHVDKSTDAFAARMNEKAARLGMVNSHFANPHGLPDDTHYTTARDLAILTAYALENPAFRQLVGTRKVTLDYHRLTIANSNRLLDSCDGVCGVKTGFTKKAGRCLVSAATRNGITLVCVTLNDPDDWDDHAALYDACFPRVDRYLLMPAKTSRLAVPAAGGKSDGILTNASALYGICIDGVPVTGTVRENLPPVLFAPAPAYRRWGFLSLETADGKVMSRSDLYLIAACETKKEEPSFARRFFRNFQSLWQIIFPKTAS